MLGAAGRLGRQVVASLAAADRPVVGLARTALPSDAVGQDDVVVNVASTSEDVVAAWAMAGSRARGYVDLAPTEGSRRVVEALALGTAPVAPGVGFASAIGDALAVVAGRRLVGPTRVDVTVYVPSRRSLLAGATPRERAELLDAMVAPMSVLVDGRVVTERVGEARRLAWFPRPVGPHHAAATPGTHWRTLPCVVPTLTTVRSALAMRSSTAELVQAVGNLARFDPVARAVRRRARRPGPDRGTADERWAVVVEVATAGGSLARGWAYGHDRHATTARVGALLAAHLGDGRVTSTGVPLGPTEVLDGEQLLDALAAGGDLRWSVTEAGRVG